MWTGIIALVSAAVIFFFLAGCISEGKIELIHSYHTNNIKEEDKEDYAKLFSKGLYAIGAGCLAAGLSAYFAIKSGVLLSVFSGLMIGLLFIHQAQKKYNGGWFS